MESIIDKIASRSARHYKSGLLNAYETADGLLAMFVLTDSIDEAPRVCGSLPVELLAEVFSCLRHIREGGYSYRPVLIGATEPLPDSAWEAAWKRLDKLINGNPELQARLHPAQ
jgi:hypothetical protein